MPLFVVTHLPRHIETDDDGMRKYSTDKDVQDFNLFLVYNVNAMFISYKLSVSIN